MVGEDDAIRLYLRPYDFVVGGGFRVAQVEVLRWSGGDLGRRRRSRGRITAKEEQIDVEESSNSTIYLLD